MLIGLFTLLFILLGGEHHSFLLNPEMKKDVGIYISDKDRKKEIDSLIKDIEKKEEHFQKDVKKGYEKKLDGLNMEIGSTRPQFTSEYQNFYVDLGKLQGEYISMELKARSLIKPDEWEKIMSKVLQAPDKEKVRKKLLEETKKMSDKLLKDCEKHIPDQAGKNKAKAIIDDYEKKGEELDNAYLDLSYQHLNAIRPYKVSRADFEPIRDRMLKVRQNFTENAVNMRFDLLTLVPAKEWKGFAKDLNDEFNNLGAGISK